MIALVREDRRQRRLRIGPGTRADIGARTDAGIAAVRRDRESGPDGVAVRQGQASRVAAALEGDGCVRQERQARLTGGRGGEARHEPTVLDVPAEGVEADLAGRERDRRRAEQAAGVVDDAHDGERRGVGRESRPDAERLQEAHGPVEKRDGAAVVARLGTADESRGEALARESERRGETCRPGADDGDVEIPSHRC